MPNLGDYVGHLVAEMTIARMQADLEAVRVAELYASHPLLKHLPIPHFRMPEVELEVPVIITQAPEDAPGASSRGGADPQELKRTFDRVLEEVLAEEDIAFPDRERNALSSRLDRIAMAESGPREVSVDVSRFSDAMSDAAARSLGSSAIRATGPSPRPASLSQEELRIKLRDRSMREFLKLRTPPSRLRIVADTSAIREAGGSENLTHLKLKISESGFEWIESEREGETRRRLIEE